MSSLIRRFTVAVLLVIVALVPTRAAAVTVDQIVELSRSGVTETVILALIDRDKTIFTIEPEQLVMLKSQGVSETVILAMLKSGRDEGERAAQQAADLNTNFIMSSLGPAPDVVVVGHDPDVPNGGWSPASGPVYAMPYGGIAVPYGFYGGGRRRLRAQAAAQTLPPPVPAQGRTFISPFAGPVNSPFAQPPVPHPVQTQAAPLCVGQVSGGNSQVPLSFVTQCSSLTPHASSRKR
jgi:hypothetical protein